jgi:type II secretory pathway predicted ATPase ExeA
MGNRAEEVKVVDLVDGARVARHEAEFPSDSSDPIRHFKLHVNPFMDNVNPNFFFRTEAHEDAYIKMKKCVEDDISLGLTTAISGTGKTLLTQILLTELSVSRYKVILSLVYPQMTRSALLKEVVNELGVKNLGVRPMVHNMVSSIHEEIIKLHKCHIKLVIIIDEVHFLKADSLHILRTLSNIEVPEKKLVTILLFGEDTFLERMHHPSYRSLFSRMFIRARLRPLTHEEVEQYVKFRCLVAGGSPQLFAADTFDLIYDYAMGIPREVNRVCHNALIMAAKERRPCVDRRVIQSLSGSI